MNVIRFSDLCQQGKVKGQRVFIRADLNVPQNDAGDITGAAYLKSPETSPDFRLRTGTDTALFSDTFNATTQNTNVWAYTFATLTAAQPGGGTVNDIIME